MNHIEVGLVTDFRNHAQNLYDTGLNLGQAAPTTEFNDVVELFLKCANDVVELLEETSKQQAREKEAVSVKGLHEALRTADAARIEIDRAKRNHSWTHHVLQKNLYEFDDNDFYVEGLSSLKHRLNDLLVPDLIVSTPDLPESTVSPLRFDVRGERLYMMPPPPLALPAERRASVEEAWKELKELLVVLIETSAGQNNPQFRSALERCRGALGDDLSRLNVIILGIRVSVLDQIAQRADDFLMDVDAATLVALADQMKLFLEQFSEWTDYAQGNSHSLGTEDAERRAVSNASRVYEKMMQTEPNLLEPETLDILDSLEKDANPGVEIGDSPIARRSYLRAFRELLLRIAREVVSATEDAARKILRTSMATMARAALASAASALRDLANSEVWGFDWLKEFIEFIIKR